MKMIASIALTASLTILGSSLAHASNSSLPMSRAAVQTNTTLTTIHAPNLGVDRAEAELGAAINLLLMEDDDVVYLTISDLSGGADRTRDYSCVC
jgi:hypothetical protein